jgi:hypothetical protein
MAYDRIAVDKAIESSNRAGRRIGRTEAKLVHALLAAPDPVSLALRGYMRDLESRKEES